jgi:hypothetical protein
MAFFLRERLPVQRNMDQLYVQTLRELQRAMDISLALSEGRYVR